VTIPESLLRRVEALSPQRKKLLADRLDAHARQALAFRAVPPDEAVPLTVGQRRMWELIEQHPELPINVVCQVVELRGALDPVRLRAAVDAFVARHRGLDTRVVRGGELPLQHPSPTPQITWRTNRLRETGDPTAELDAMARAQAYQTGNGETGPLVIFTLVTVAERHHALIVTAQNLVIDAMSFSILLEEVGQLYQGVTPPAAPHQMVDAASWQRRWLDSAAYRQRLAHWQQLLAALEVTPMAPTLPRPPARRFIGERIAFDIAERTRARLAALCRENRATPFMGMAAVTLVFCAQHSNSRDVVIGSLATGRFRPELERIVGFLLHILPVHAQPRPEHSFVDVLAQVRGHVLAAQQHDGVPYEELAKELGSSIFDLLFIYENIPGPAEHFGDLAVSSRDVDKGCARFDLSLAIYDEPKRMHGWLEYDVSLYARADVEAMIERFRGLLESVVRDPGRKLAP
jgi:Condensation domain